MNRARTSGRAQAMSVYAAGTTLLLATAWLCWSMPAAAIQEATPQPEWRYAVAGVAAEDWLNVRAHAGVQSPVVGRLQPDADGVVVTGVRLPVRGSVWWEIAWPETSTGRAWVNARYLTPTAPHDEREQGFPLACSGTEPFWSLRVDGDRARFDRMNGDTGEWHAGSWNVASGQWGRFAIRLESGQGIEPGHAAVARDFRFCSDGMSDFQYAYDVTLILPDGEGVLAGCCRRMR